MSKRKDIQWLRATAILSVLCFHIKPQLFPFGYLGVDIFFVISGYLMAAILSKEISVPSFYLSRIKRIFPSYLFFITSVLASGYFILLPSDYNGLKTETIWSFLFINNLYPFFHKKQYFEMVSEYKFLLHSWSLGVEIQFYLISPFLIRFLLSRKNSFFWTFVFGGSSFILQQMSPNEEISFGFMFCRIWQFLIGSLVFIKQKESNYLFLNVSSQENKSLLECSHKINNKNRNMKLFVLGKIVVFIFLLVICFHPFQSKSKSMISKILCTCCIIFTGIFIWIKPFKCDNRLKWLNNLVVYFGDASYSMYLFHWPIIVYFKYLKISWPISLIILIIILTTIFFHEFFEKVVAGRSSLSVSVIIALLYFTVLSFLFLSANNQHNLTNSLAIRDNEKQFDSCKSIISKNTEYQKLCEPNSLIEKYYTFRAPEREFDYLNLRCSIKLNSKSNKTVLIIGNSFVSFELTAIMTAIKQSKIQFSEAFVISQPHCSLLVGILNECLEASKGIDGSHDRIFEILKPDVIIHAGRFIRFVKLKFALDSDYDEIKRSILHVSKFTGRLIIIEPSPFFNDRVDYKNPSTISHALYVNGSLEQYKLPIETHHKTSKGVWRRVEEAVKHCSNCLLVNTERIFCTQEYCPVVDLNTNITRYCDSEHLTPTESLRTIPFILEALDG